MPADFENSAVATGLEKVSFHPIQRRAIPKKVQTTGQLCLFCRIVRLHSKILQARLQQYVNRELPDVQAGFREGKRKQRSNCQHPLDHWKSKSSRKTSTFALLTMPKSLTVWITTNYGKFLEMGLPDHLTCLLRNLHANLEATGYGTTELFKIEKGVNQD